MDYVYVGTLPFEDTDVGLRIEPKENGTPFSHEFDPVREASLIARGLIVRVHPEPAKRRKE
jgi:hypothetical protein